ncbi:GAF and ANTAR domain-containing protein [Pseudarthrobacter sp. J75]|uniref:GAF and ANTAR domain-containing protein n=1 Tax=unclassified Pseudarthrobacter TaxID=2647000 RepID=UPI002E81C242|nr:MULTISPECIES: GAF and ANTAR domain-containing protein [unclassified Pseudarthrobacter]MEE2521934.1 GAF and ANTAR domain-containing protein [Pseudarthrobacter sp. J47]MEE2528859.1 GAF and ANTAR domain-containing protein [Pseudarthrobacter sp. J75]
MLESDDVGQFLTELATFTIESFSPSGSTVHCGVTLLRGRKATTAASSDAKALAVDEAQNSFGEGPCLAAMEVLRPVLVRDTSTEQRWPRYMRAVRREGIGAILAVPLMVDGDTRAALNLYTEAVDGFSSQDVERAEMFAAHSAKALRLALKIAGLTEARNDLVAAMRSRTVIDIAIGVIMAQNRCSQESAHSILIAASNNRNVKMRDLAATVVDSVAPETEVVTHFQE